MCSLKIGILREEKIPFDRRTPLSPTACARLMQLYPEVELIVQPSGIRCYHDSEYQAVGAVLREDLRDCDVLMGVKEVPKESLIDDKRYLFFSHTIKKQSHNRELLRALLRKRIEMIDYEAITDENSNRLAGFGRFAGVVGAYNGILGYGRKTALFHLKPAYLCRDRAEMEKELKSARLPNLRIALTGGGRVANGAIETLSCARVRRVTPTEFLANSHDEPVYCQLNPRDYVQRKGDRNFDLQDFLAHPERFDSIFRQYVSKTDIYISAHYWDPRAPRMFELSDVKLPCWRIGVVADITCDVPGSVPTTIRPTSIDKPFYGYNIAEDREDVPFEDGKVCVMAVDNLPSELPRDASEEFGRDLMDHVLPRIVRGDGQGVLERATICRQGELTSAFEYLQTYAA